jgi:predicted lactoylglutathione lyase
MIDHLSLPVSDFARSRAFYIAALKPLGYEMVMEFSREQIPELASAHVAGLGAGGKPDFWLSQVTTGSPSTIHVAIAASSREMVDAFYEAAVKAGGKPNGSPGVRAQYHPSYYGAFVLDPDGHNVEAVCHAPG